MIIPQWEVNKPVISRSIANGKIPTFTRKKSWKTAISRCVLPSSLVSKVVLHHQCRLHIHCLNCRPRNAMVDISFQHKRVNTVWFHLCMKFILEKDSRWLHRGLRIRVCIANSTLIILVDLFGVNLCLVRTHLAIYLHLYFYRIFIVL